MSLTISCVLIAPIAFVDAADALSIALGYAQEPGTYSLPLLTDGELTHKGTHTWASDAFLTMLDNARNGIIPAELVGVYEPADVQALVNALIVSTRTNCEPLDHWRDVLNANGLTQPVYEGDA